MDEIVLNKFRANTGPFQGRKLAACLVVLPPPGRRYRLRRGFGGWDIKVKYIIDVCCSWRKWKEIMLLGGWVASRKVASTSFCGGGEKAERNNEEQKRKERALLKQMILDEIVLNKFRANTGPFQGRKLALFYLLFPGSAPTMFKVPKTQEK